MPGEWIDRNVLERWQNNLGLVICGNMPTSLTVWPPFKLPLSRWDLAKSGYNSKFDTLRISRPRSCESANIWIDIRDASLLPVVGAPKKSLLNKVGLSEDPDERG